MKSKIAAGLFALFLGGFGIHQFYLGSIGRGLLFLLLSWTAIPAFIAFVQAILYLVASDEEFNQKYVVERRFF